MEAFTAEGLNSLVAEAGLVLDPDVCGQVVAALDIGSNVILTGPPGTGKTTLAYLAAELGRRAVRCTGYQPVTATSDWNTDVTIGHYENNDGSRLFQPGIFLEAIESGRWLIVDELNRSDFDRAFGQLFTVLAGQAVTLPFHRKGSELPLAMVPWHADPPAGTEVLSIPHTWRMLATMNEVDKDLLHRLSYALMRRFAFIEVTAPSIEAMQTLLDRPGGDVVVPLLAVLAVRDLGPAMFLDAARFAARRKVDDDNASRIRYQAFCAYLLPQLDGCDDEDARLLFEALAGAFEVAELNELRRVVRSITGSPAGHAGPPERKPRLATAS
jgi:MoxR-like ATPase